MIRGTVKVKSRPIKLAFLVNPTDQESLLKAIEINTFLWGGMYNPIIPTYRETSQTWEDSSSKIPDFQSIISGYLDNFDPDYVVPMGECSDYSFDMGYRKKINDVSEIFESFEEYKTPNYGIGLFEVLDYFFKEELKFQQRDPQHICIPRFEPQFQLFLASTFGTLPKNLDAIFWKNFTKPLDAKELDCSTSNYVEFLNPQKLFFMRMTGLYLKSDNYRKKSLFFLDANSSLDIMDYWNLRAIGWDIFPIPKQFTQSDKTRKLILNFAEQNYLPRGPSPEIYHRITTLKSRSISEDEHQHFLNSLEESKIVSQTLYPRIWDESARSLYSTEHIRPCKPISEIVEHDVWTDRGAINFKALPPKFLSKWHETPAFANEIEWWFDDDKALLADVIPEEGGELAQFISGVGSLDKFRLFGKGLVYLGQHREEIINLSHLQAEAIFMKWLEVRGWRVELSPPGRIAKQMLKQLGRINDISILAQEEILQLLRKMNSSDGKFLAEEEVRGKIQQAENQQSIFSKIASEMLGKKILPQLIAAKVFQLGMVVQCPICAQSSWYSVKDVDYELQCPRCLESLSFPPASKEVKWAYRTLGPFSSSNQAHGVYTVLLTLRFFHQFTYPDSAITPLMSFTAQKDEIEIETDLALFFQESRFLDPKTELIFAECKTSNSFQQRDIDRMVDLGKAFPEAILVFATLKESLSDDEKTILRLVANRSRKDRKDKHPFNPIMILTGIELISETHFTLDWEKVGGIRAKFAQKINPNVGTRILLEFCDFTQQIYLDMDTWHESPEEQPVSATSPPFHGNLPE